MKNLSIFVIIFIAISTTFLLVVNKEKKVLAKDVNNMDQLTKESNFAKVKGKNMAATNIDEIQYRNIGIDDPLPVSWHEATWEYIIQEDKYEDVASTSYVTELSTDESYLLPKVKSVFDDYYYEITGNYVKVEDGFMQSLPSFGNEYSIYIKMNDAKTTCDHRFIMHQPIDTEIDDQANYNLIKYRVIEKDDTKTRTDDDGNVITYVDAQWKYVIQNQSIVYFQELGFSLNGDYFEDNGLSRESNFYKRVINKIDKFDDDEGLGRSCVKVENGWVSGRDRLFTFTLNQGVSCDYKLVMDLTEAY